VNAAQRAATWAKISELLREHEDAQSDAIREAVAATWENLRTKLQVVALSEGAPTNETEAK
jgi:hypothetical protein